MQDPGKLLRMLAAKVQGVGMRWLMVPSFVLVVERSTHICEAKITKFHDLGR